MAQLPFRTTALSDVAALFASKEAVWTRLHDGAPANPAASVLAAPAQAQDGAPAAVGTPVMTGADTPASAASASAPAGSGSGSVRASVVNLGCRVNRVESDWMEDALMSAGFSLTRPEDAHVVVINTCAVTGEAQAKTRHAVRQAAGYEPVQIVAVTGCVASLFPAELTGLSPKVHVMKSKLSVHEEVRQLWEALCSGPGCSSVTPGGPCTADGGGPAQGISSGFGSLTGTGLAHSSLAPFFDNVNCDDQGRTESASGLSTQLNLVRRARRGVKVQDGCDCRCTYCIVWKARGHSESVDLQLIDRSLDTVLEQGAVEIDLTGVNLGKFRSQTAEHGRMGLAGLIDYVAGRIRGQAVLRCSSLEPHDINTGVLEAIAKNADVVCPFLHLPLQSGSEEILRRMKRPYTAEGFAQLVAQARATVPHFSLTTDIMVGFPGETDVLFEESLAFCREMAFSKMHVFRFSPRPGTPAADMDGQVAPQVSKERSQTVRDLAQQLRVADAAARVGDTEYVLLEQLDTTGEKAIGVGSTGSYHRVRMHAGSTGPLGVGLYRAHLERSDSAGMLYARALDCVRLVGGQGLSA